MDRHQEAPPGAFGSLWKSRAGLALIVFLAVGLFYLYAEHRAPLLGSLP